MRKHILIIWIIFVFVLLVMPVSTSTSDIVGSIPYSDKIVHLFMFGIFSFLIICNYREKYTNDALFLVSALLGAVYAALGEFVQSFIPSRTCSVYDFYAGALGSLIFVTIYYVRRNKA